MVTPKGNILINANLDTSPPQIRASLEQLGFRWSDIKILLNSQAHSDHVGGAAQIVRETRAQNTAMEGDADVVESGGETDFIAPSPPSKTHFAAVKVDRVLKHGDTVSLGGTTLTAHKTAGHTRGCTTWTMRTHIPGDPADKQRTIVIVGGTGFWSEYHFTTTPEHKESYPGIAADFERTFATLRALPAEIFFGAHGGYFDLTTKLKQYKTLGPRTFIDPEYLSKSLVFLYLRFHSTSLLEVHALYDRQRDRAPRNPTQRRRILRISSERRLLHAKQ